MNLSILIHQLVFKTLHLYPLLVGTSLGDMISCATNVVVLFSPVTAVNHKIGFSDGVNYISARCVQMEQSPGKYPIFVCN